MTGIARKNIVSRGAFDVHRIAGIKFEFRRVFMRSRVSCYTKTCNFWHPILDLRTLLAVALCASFTAHVIFDLPWFGGASAT